jgi:hypothetical protein
VGDLKIETRLQISGKEALFVLEIEDGLQQFRLELGTQNRLLHLEGQELQNIYPLNLSLPQQAFHLSFANWDNHILLRIDGQDVFENQIPSKLGENKRGGGSFRFLARDADVELKEIRVFRDIHYASHASGTNISAKSWNIPEGSFFMLGDNTNSSTDSRVWKFVPRKNLKGRPWLRLLHVDFPFYDTDWNLVKFGYVP